MTAKMLEMNQVELIPTDHVGESCFLRRIIEGVEPSDILHVELLQHRALRIGEVTLAIIPDPEKVLQFPLEHGGQGSLVDLDLTRPLPSSPRAYQHPHPAIGRSRRCRHLKSCKVG